MHDDNPELTQLRQRFERLRNQRARGIITSDEFHLTLEDMVAEYAGSEAP